MKNFLLGFLLSITAVLAGNWFAYDGTSYIVTKDLKKFGIGKTADNPAYNPIIKLLDHKGHAFCSGFVVDANYIVTAAHCLNDGGKLSKEELGVMDDAGVNTNTKAKAVGISSRNDLGLVSGDFSNFKVLKVEFSHFGFLSSAPFYLMCGFPMGQKNLICNPFFPSSTSGFAVVGAGYIVAGMSGGPVINSVTGEAVAVNSYADEGRVGVFPLQGLLGAFRLEE